MFRTSTDIRLHFGKSVATVFERVALDDLARSKFCALKDALRLCHWDLWFLHCGGSHSDPRYNMAKRVHSIASFRFPGESSESPPEPI